MGGPMTVGTCLSVKDRGCAVATRSLSNINAMESSVGSWFLVRSVAGRLIGFEGEYVILLARGMQRQSFRQDPRFRFSHMETAAEGY